ncbi:hypothetical protein GGR88_002569 [Sphingomonas jejuensis]|uniref:Lipoprotein n=1 Tax=Sphingomonas jejuensis TaxID=904715 RepID=A0ABX0XPA2_9SPHN|nr:hypothetical protein [Sphingomonas jejuensis]NJC35055.1 hypothetical protein [Sphingomonas jejuensis]
MRPLIAIAALALASGCAKQPLTDAQQAARAERDARLDEDERDALAGLTPGQPQACIPINQSRSTTFIGDRTILYRVNQNLIYRNDPPNGCPGLRRGMTIITRTPGTQLCRGDIVRVADLVAGIKAGGCGLGDFVPYRRDAAD